MLAACAAAQSPDPAAGFPAGTTFAWLGTDSGGMRRNAPADPTRYTIAFEPPGRARLRLDCNRGSAQWTRDGAKLALSPVAATKMMCASGSLDAAYASDLSQVESWRVEREELVLSGRDGSTMRFRALPN
jgi:heat shock protein HslJ